MFLVNFLLATLFICGIPLLIIVIYKVFIFLWNIRERKYRDFVIKYSVAVRQLLVINKKYYFYTSKDYDNQHIYDNEKFYNLISCEDFLIYRLQFIQNDVLKDIQNIRKNIDAYSNYAEEVNQITLHNQFVVSTEKMNLHYLLLCEQKIFDKLKLKPQLSFYVTVTLYRSNINGFVYEKKSKFFDSQEVICLIKKLNNKSGYFYNDKKIWDALCRVERGMVSNRLRFKIYDRDGWKCCKCGKSNKDGDLEIDHIIPIAKGGKSTYDNLQTLCHHCNIEKGSNY